MYMYVPFQNKCFNVLLQNTQKISFSQDRKQDSNLKSIEKGLVEVAL